GQTNGDRLLRRSGAMFAFPNVFHFFADKLASLGGRRFAFAFVLVRAFDCFFFWHNKMVSPLERCLDVNKKLVPREQPVLSAALLAAALFFLLAPLPFMFLFFAILLSALSGRGGFVWFSWILLCVHDAFLIVGLMFRSFACSDSTLLIKSPWRAIWTETHNREGGWLSYQKPYWTCHHVTWLRQVVICS